MQQRHINREKYFSEQVYTTREHVMPFLRDLFVPGAGKKVLEVGCGEGGNLVPFLESGCMVTGVDLSEKKIKNASDFLSDYASDENLKLFVRDIYQAGNELGGPFDLIMMRDVIEHIHDQSRFMAFIKDFLKDDGVIFLAFPPWYNPFGGHQQICASRILSRLPYFHLLPVPIYTKFLKVFGESVERIENLLEVKATGISIERFHRIICQAGFVIEKERHYLVNPNYHVKFGLRPRKLYRLFSLPFLRNFITTSEYAILKKA